MSGIFYSHDWHDAHTRCHGMHDARCQTSLGRMDGQVLPGRRQDIHALNLIKLLMKAFFTFLSMLTFYFCIYSKQIK